MLAKISSNHIHAHCPWWITLIARVGHFLCLNHFWHPIYRIPVHCFHSLIFMDVKAARCSGAVLSVNIHINMLNMHNMGWFRMNMLNIEFLLFMQDNAESSNSQRVWDCSSRETKINVWQRTICQHRANATIWRCACLQTTSWESWNMRPDFALPKAQFLGLCSDFSLSNFIYVLPANLGWPTNLYSVAIGSR